MANVKLCVKATPDKELYLKTFEEHLEEVKYRNKASVSYIANR